MPERIVGEEFFHPDKKEVREIIGDYKERVRGLVDPGYVRVDASIKGFNSAVGRALHWRESQGEDLSAEKEAYAAEQLVISLFAKGGARRLGNKIIFNTSFFQSRQKKESFRNMAHTIRTEGIPEFEADGHDSRAERAWKFLQRYFSQQDTELVDEYGNEFDLMDYYRSTPNISVEDRLPALHQFLKERKALRLRLTSNRQKVAPEKAQELIDEEGGFLCVLDPKLGKYRKISAENDLYALLGGSINLTKALNTSEESLFDNPDFPVRRSDLSNLDYVPKRLGKLGGGIKSPMINGVRYLFPRRFSPTSEEFAFAPEVSLSTDDEILPLSDEYAVLIRTQGGKRQAMLLNSLSSQERKERRQAKGGKKYSGLDVKSAETVSRLEPWLPEKFLPRLKKEGDLHYSQRIAPCRDIDVLVQVYRDLVDGTGFELQKLDLKTQLLFATYYYHLPDEDKSFVQQLIRRHGADFVTAFESCEFDWGMGEVLIRLAGEQGSKEVFALYTEIVFHAESAGDGIHHLLEQGEAGSPLSKVELRQGLLARAKNLLLEADKKLAIASSDQAKSIVASLVQDFREEDDFQSSARGLFAEMSASLGSKKEVDLKKYHRRQELIVKGLQERGLSGVLIKALQARGATAPVPEIHWRVDRSSEEYNRRFGIDIKKFLTHFNQKKHEKLLLEFGPGNGTFRIERGSEVPGYQDVAICNCLYYPLNTFIYNIIDFKKLESVSGPLTEEEKRLLADFLYKILVIRPGQASLDNFEYDERVVRDLASDINLAKKHLRKKSMLLDYTMEVPTTVSSRDEKGNVTYPYKIKKPQSSAFHKACVALSFDIDSVLIDDFEDQDLYRFVPAYAPGTIISDFSDIKNLKSEQVDVSLGVRSTVYLRDDAYIDFMEEMSHKLRTDGIHIDDSIRDNDGWYYRIAELLEVQERIGRSLQVIVGPGFPGEDHNQKDMVPLAVVMTRDERKLEYIEVNLQDEFELVDLEDIAYDPEYLRSLDSSGKVHDSVYGDDGYSIAA